MTNTSASNLITKSTAAFDWLGRRYQQQTFAVNVGSGTVGVGLTGGTWYDLAGNVLMSKMVGSSTNTFTKNVYDGLNRLTTTYVGYTPTGGRWPAVPSLTAARDVVFQQNETYYDRPSNVILTAARSRLVTSGTATGDLGVSGGTLARSSYAAAWFDGIGRTENTANYGINGGTAMTVSSRPASAPRSGTLVLADTTAYKPGVKRYETIDPMGRVDQRTLDIAGREIRPSRTSSPAARRATKTSPCRRPIPATAWWPRYRVQFGYRHPGHEMGLRHGDGRPTAAWPEPTCSRRVLYPDSASFTMSGGTPAFSGRPSRRQQSRPIHYNQLGERATMTDQNQTTHVYALDGLGRPTTDSVWAAGSGVTRPSSRSCAPTSRGACSRASPAIAVPGARGRQRRALRLQRLRAAHRRVPGPDGAVVASGSTASPWVQYTYSSGTANTIRPVSVIYPDRHADDRLRLQRGGRRQFKPGELPSDERRQPSSGTLSQFSYLGPIQIVTETYPQPTVTLDYSGGTAATYPGLDNFDR